MSLSMQIRNAASVLPEPVGAEMRVGFPARMDGRADLSACGRYAMASAVEAMLDPGIMQVVIEPSGDIEAPYAGLARRRADALKGMFTNAGFDPFQPPVLVQPTSSSPIGVWGVVLTVPSRS